MHQPRPNLGGARCERSGDHRGGAKGDGDEGVDSGEDQHRDQEQRTAQAAEGAQKRTPRSEQDESGHSGHLSGLPGSGTGRDRPPNECRTPCPAARYGDVGALRGRSWRRGVAVAVEWGQHREPDRRVRGEEGSASPLRRGQGPEAHHYRSRRPPRRASPRALPRVRLRARHGPRLLVPVRGVRRDRGLISPGFSAPGGGAAAPAPHHLPAPPDPSSAQPARRKVPGRRVQ